MKIVIIVEGKTEKAFLPYLKKFLQTRLEGKMPRLGIHSYDGRIPTGDKLKRVVQNLLNGRNAVDHVIALTDVYTGSRPPEFTDADDAKNKMRRWVGVETRFHPHAAQFEFEAWLLPYWPTIQKLAGCKKNPPGINPEKVNHDNPPARRIKEIFEAGKCRDSYVKVRDAGRILQDNDLSVAIAQCLELKAFVNTIISICGGEKII
ncbi:MAG TPA: DUF4276 family protein [Candidatus Deferrimicrobium sp.]|nr:DUF4276 family protein [Candidatus Deferrimicrobium sp.]